MRRSRFQSRRGFTLIELILVLAVIAFVIGIVAPTLRGFSAGSRLRDTADRFIMLTRLARVQSLSTGQVHRVTVDTSGARCVVSAVNAGQLVEISSAMDGTLTIPDGVTIQMKDPQGAPRDYVEFYPNGRTQAAKLRISLPEGEGYLDVECVAPTEGFFVVPSGVKK